MTYWRDTRRAWHAALVGLLAISAFGGCGGEDAPAAGGAKSLAARSHINNARNAPKKVSEKVAEKPADRPDAAAEVAKPAGMPERIAILTPGGPLVIEAWLTIDGRPHGEGLQKLVAEALDAADADGIGRPTWRELANKKDIAATPGAADVSADAQLKMWTVRYDWNSDGQVQSAEAAAWLGRDAGKPASPFRLSSSRSYSPHPRETSRVWTLLDADSDGRLSQQEIARTAAALLSLDADDDHVILSRDTASLRDELTAAGGDMSMPAGRATDHYAAIHLEPRIEIDRLHYLFTDLYAPRQDLGPDSFPAFRRLFEQLDANDDDWLERQELAQLLTTDPYLALSVAFAAAEDGNMGRATVEVRHAASAVTVVSQTADRIVIAVGGARLLVSAHDLVGNASSGQALQRQQLRMNVHDQCDALWEELDANADGRLGERELAAGARHILQRDANGDGELADDELPYSMIVAFSLGDAADDGAPFAPTFASHPRGPQAEAAWFAAADFNGDGDVSRREFLGSREQFATLDANGDEFIDAGEAAAAAAPVAPAPAEGSPDRPPLKSSG